MQHQLVVQIVFVFLCFFVPLWLKALYFVFAFSADHSLSSAETESAADIREHFASFVSFQRIEPGQPFAVCVVSADVSEHPVCKCSGFLCHLCHLRHNF